MMDKVHMIEGSFRVLKRGWLSLIPLAGLFFALGALIAFSKVFYHTKDDWNPARWHLYSGAGLALLSLLLHALILTSFLVAALSVGN